MGQHHFWQNSIIVLLLCNFTIQLDLLAQSPDTLRIESTRFGQTREVYVQAPKKLSYASTAVRYPVIYVLDAQHVWFADPVRSDIKHLAFCHDIPEAIIVSIPLLNRNKECAIGDINGEILPLLTFITKELELHLKNYQPSDYRMIIGHSFSASFALYAYLRAPEFLDMVIAHSPLDQIDALSYELAQSPERLSNIYLSVGGASMNKDGYHHQRIDALKQTAPRFMESIRYLEAPHSRHSAVPIITTATLLTEHFKTWSTRYDSIAAVDMNYAMLGEPMPLEQLIPTIEKARSFDNSKIFPDIAELNGIASRYLNSGYYEHAHELYAYAVQLYPNFYEFHWYLGELGIELGREKSVVLKHLQASHDLLLKEQRFDEQATYQAELEALIDSMQ